MKNFTIKAIGLISFVIISLQGLSQTPLKKGDFAPAFEAIDNSGKTIKLKALLGSHKSVVLFFYRGQWCPYCNKHIQQLQDSLQLLTQKGAYIVGVTPETRDNITKTVNKTKASFSIIQDNGYAIMKRYGVNYVLDEEIVKKYRGFGLDLDKANGNTDHVLPVPATYIIDQTGKITFVQFDKDYTRRASVRDILANL